MPNPPIDFPPAARALAGFHSFETVQYFLVCYRDANRRAVANRPFIQAG